ncbi:MAG: hypothetical protein KA312_01580 [Sphingorhabdus sp.]|nr:hypothetical protein [Sphingorhabdus sp.]
MQFSAQNVYQMFTSNGGEGFWVWRTTWDASVARVVKVGPFTGPPPYYGSPKVLIDVYNNQGELRDGAAVMSVPGTYKTWRLIDPPAWVSTVQLRPLDDPALDEALAKLYAKRSSKKPIDPTTRIKLDVPYARKDEAKKLGAKWEPTEKSWWLPNNDSKSLAKAVKLGFLEQKPS